MTMTQFLIRQMPEDLYRRLKARAKASRRSMNQEIIGLLEQSMALAAPPVAPLPEPLQGTFPIDDDWLYAARQQGRA